MMNENFLWLVHKKEPGLLPASVFNIDMKIEISGAFFSVLHRMHFVSENNANFAFKLIEKSMQRIYLIRRQAKRTPPPHSQFFFCFSSANRYRHSVMYVKYLYMYFPSFSSFSVLFVCDYNSKCKNKSMWIRVWYFLCACVCVRSWNI